MTSVLTDAQQYLTHYWPPRPDSECRFILQFLHDVYADPVRRSCAARGTLLEVGGGPVIDKLISASGCVRGIVHLEPSGDATGASDSPKRAAIASTSGVPSAATHSFVQRQSAPTPVRRTGRFGRR